MRLDDRRTYSAYLCTAGVVIKLSTGAHKTSFNTGVLLQHICSAEVALKEGPSDAGGHTGVVQTLFIDLLHHSNYITSETNIGGKARGAH